MPAERAGVTVQTHDFSSFSLIFLVHGHCVCHRPFPVDVQNQESRGPLWRWYRDHRDDEPRMGSTIHQTQDPRNGTPYQPRPDKPSPDSISPQIYNGRKTDQCGVVVFGTSGTSYGSYYCMLWAILPHGSETQNILNERGDGYEHVYEYIPIAQPNSSTIAKLNALRATDVCGDRTSRRDSF